LDYEQAPDTYRRFYYMLAPTVNTLGGRIMNMNLAIIGLTATLLAPAQIVAAAEKDKDPLAVVMLGAASEWGFPGSDFSLGPSVAVEFSVIKDWLEIEIGGAKLFRRGTSEWESDVVFRKPFTLSETTELMVGLGPVWSKARGESGKIGTTFVADFMFWSSPEREYGWFMEPSYSINPGNDRSLAVSVGLIIGLH
jgi:hypothetical protein